MPSLFIYAHLDAPARAWLATQPLGPEVYYADKFALTATDRVAFRTAEVAFGNVPADWLANAPRLRWLQLESVGFEYYQGLPAGAIPAGLRLTNLAGQFAAPAAETALAGLLALYRGLDQLIPAQAARTWCCLEVRPTMRVLHDSHVIVLGNGSIGRRLAELLAAFRCRVQTFARTSATADLRTPAALDAALPAADVVVCCLPKTAATRHLVHAARLARMKPTAIVVNIGRASVVDTAALVRALRENRLGGAVIDVFDEEPLPSDHPLWTCPRTILTQHTGGGYADELLDKARCFAANLARYRAGQPVENVVDFARGY